jgi:hypothetical protein
VARTRWYAALLLVPCLVACGGGHQQGPTPASATPVPTTGPALRLTAATFLGIRYLRPVGWTAQRTLSSAHAGDVTWTAPERRGTLYVERNDCAACVDTGLVMHGRRSGQPDAGNALASYFPTSHHVRDPYHVRFTKAAPVPYAANGELTVTRSHDTLTGYVVVIVTLPTAESATAAQILASVQT